MSPVLISVEILTDFNFLCGFSRALATTHLGYADGNKIMASASHQDSPPFIQNLPKNKIKCKESYKDQTKILTFSEGYGIIKMSICAHEGERNQTEKKDEKKDFI